MFRVRTWRRVGEALHSISNRRDKMMIGPHVERKAKWRTGSQRGTERSYNKW